MIGTAIECPDCEKGFPIDKKVAVIYCPYCDCAVKNPLYDENRYKNGKPRGRDAHEDASDDHIKTGKAFRDAMTTPPEFETDWGVWRNRRRYRKD